jgi:hypothetical protein
VAVRIPDIGPDLAPGVLNGRGEELRTARSPLLVHGVDVGDADVEEGGRPVGVGRRLEDYLGLVVGWAAES